MLRFRARNGSYVQSFLLALFSKLLFFCFFVLVRLVGSRGGISNHFYQTNCFCAPQKKVILTSSFVSLFEASGRPKTLTIKPTRCKGVQKRRFQLFTFFFCNTCTKHVSPGGPTKLNKTFQNRNKLLQNLNSLAAKKGPPKVFVCMHP